MCAVESFKNWEFHCIAQLVVSSDFLAVFFKSSPEAVFKWDRFLSVPERPKYDTHHL